MKACFKSSSPPDSLRDFLTYVHVLDYQSTPDYSKCMQMFVRELSCLGLRDDGKDLDWTAATSKVSLSSTHYNMHAEFGFWLVTGNALWG